MYPEAALKGNSYSTTSFVDQYLPVWLGNHFEYQSRDLCHYRRARRSLSQGYSYTSYGKSILQTSSNSIQELHKVVRMEVK